jgi:hypothetical protein
MLAFLRRCGAESLDHFHQAGERVGLHFLHHLTSVCLDCDLADAELATDLLECRTRSTRRSSGQNYRVQMVRVRVRRCGTGAVESETGWGFRPVRN